MIAYSKLLVDFGLVVLVWVVQFAIYPGFKYFAIEDLKRWHGKYTLGISWVVAPLMLAQLGIAIYLLTLSIDVFFIGNFVLVLLTWVITFLWAIPLHQQIEKVDALDTVFEDLLKINKLRAWIWTLIFIWTFYKLVY